MTTAILDYICRKAREAHLNSPQCDLRCEEREAPLKTKKVKESPYECDLRCKEEKMEFPEYIGPVHYSIMTPPFELYKQTMIETALINLVYFLMGSTVMIVLFHTLAFKYFWPLNLHILLITMGSQVFIPVSFMLQHPLDGAAIWMKWQDRQYECFILRLVGIVCIWFPTIFIICYGEYRVITFHSFFGFLSAFTCIGDLIMLIIIRKNEESVFHKFERYICLPSFLLSTLAFISGIFRLGMRQWYPSPRVQIPIFLTIFCITYSALIVFRPIKSFVDSFRDNSS